MGDLGLSSIALDCSVDIVLLVAGTGGGAPNLIPPSLAIRAAILDRRVASSSSADEAAAGAEAGAASSPKASIAGGVGGTVRLGDIGL